MKFFDSQGYLHHTTALESENGILFAAEFYLLTFLLKNDLKGAWVPVGNCLKYSPNGFWYDPNPSHKNNHNAHFSHDNMTGLYVLCFLLGFKNSKILKTLPTLKWNNRYWLHPRDIIFYSILKEKKWSYIGMPLLFIMSLISCLRKPANTSGKILWWIRIQTLRMHPSNLIKSIANKMLLIMEFCLTLNHGSAPMKSVFKTYFTVTHHPIRRLIFEYYKFGINKKVINEKM